MAWQWQAECVADAIMEECIEKMEEIKYDMRIVGIMNDEHERCLNEQNNMVDRCIDIVKDACSKF